MRVFCDGLRGADGDETDGEVLVANSKSKVKRNLSSRACFGLITNSDRASEKDFLETVHYSNAPPLEVRYSNDPRCFDLLG